MVGLSRSRLHRKPPSTIEIQCIARPVEGHKLSLLFAQKCDFLNRVPAHRQVIILKPYTTAPGGLSGADLRLGVTADLAYLLQLKCMSSFHSSTIRIVRPVP